MLLLIGLILLIIGITKLPKANTIKKEAYELEQKNDEKLNKLHDRERFILSKEETLSDLNKQITMLKNDIN
ncbi:TPA: chromosome segregation protein [Enterococcus faecium]|nr:chromosome segregation protein [Enterococcus faecium]